MEEYEVVPVSQLVAPLWGGVPWQELARPITRGKGDVQIGEVLGSEGVCEDRSFLGADPAVEGGDVRRRERWWGSGIRRRRVVVASRIDVPVRDATTAYGRDGDGGSAAACS